MRTLRTIFLAALVLSMGGLMAKGAPMEKIKKTDAQWKEELPYETFCIMRQSGTEKPFHNKYWDQHEDGEYRCAACGHLLFKSDSKFDSGTGWPSYFQPAAKDAVDEHRDINHGMIRTEVVCHRCGGHLGHVFPDGPAPTGTRYCINSAALKFEPLQSHVATFAMGCFWQPDEYFRTLPGVLKTEVGYTGGRVKNPSYKQVSYTDTGHAEAINVTFDPAKISYKQLLEHFWNNHDPTTLNQQGPDRGEQYRSAIFTHGPEQEKEAKASLKKVESEQVWGDDKVVTQIAEAKEWWPAEEYHQKYLQKAGHTQCHLPKPPKKRLKL